MNPSTMRVYMRCASHTEQRLRKSNPPKGQRLPETSRLAPGVSGSNRTSLSLSEHYKRDSPQLGEPVARDVVRRRWTRTTTKMDDLRGQDAVASVQEQPPARFDAVDREKEALSNRKSQDGGDRLTRLTDLTPNRKGVYVTPVRTAALALARALTHLPSERCQIRQIRQHPPPSGGFQTGFGVKPGVNLTATGSGVGR